MSYIDVLIPLIIGLLILFLPDSALKQNDPAYFQKKANFKKIGIALILVALLYFGIKVYEAGYL